MSEGLKAFEQLKQHYVDIWDHDFSDIDENEQYEIIEKELKALDIIKEYLYIDDTNTLRIKKGLNVNLSGITFMNQDVIDLLKEVLS